MTKVEKRRFCFEPSEIKPARRRRKANNVCKRPPPIEVPKGVTNGTNGITLPVSENEEETRFDPYQVFQVEHKPCLLLHVKVLRGRNITKGWAADLLDTPDPYVELRIRTAPDNRKRTKTIDNEPNPVWNETFVFLLDESARNIMQISLMEDNYIMDTTIGSCHFDLKKLSRRKWTKKTFVINQVCEVDLELMSELDRDPTLRYSLCLCPEEKEFLSTRRSHTMEAMGRLLGSDGPHCNSEVPRVAVIGSGGGFRAMVGMSGAIKALSETGVLDCVTYTGGLSGSSWYISTLYSHPKWPDISHDTIQEEIKNHIDSSLLWLLKPNSVCRYLERIMEKRRQGQPVSFTDFFGHLVGETLLKDRLDCKLTDQQEKIKNGDVPMPLYTCVHVKKDVSARAFQEWVEFTPFEIGLPKYGTYMKSELFGSKFFMGKLCRQFPEQPLHFLQGIWGSAFCILFNRLVDDNRKLDPVEMIRQEMEKQLDEDECSSDSDDDGDESDEEGSDCDGPLPAKRSKLDVNKKPSLKRQKSVPKNERDGFWTNVIKGLVESKKYELLSTRAGRAAVVHNFMRGLSLQQTYPLSPFSPPTRNNSTSDFNDIFEMYPTDMKRLYMVDAGLTFNSPYPLVLRPQRAVDVILSFDFSARPSDDSQPFKELLLAEKWARINRLPFPPIDPKVFEREGMKELYIFRHPTDLNCPIILHFVLVNKDFRMYKKPGILRRTNAEKKFADFSLFNDPNTPYSTFNFKYPHEAFDRLSKLMEFNTLKHLREIKEAIAEGVRKRRDLPLRFPIPSNKVKLLRIKSMEDRKRLKNYLIKMEHLCSPRLPPTEGFFSNLPTMEEENSQSDDENEAVFLGTSSL